jgi:beta-lactam-binding protein with PASTA domain
MPNVKGMNLQEAQDELQGRGSYLMDQEDAGKHHRIQVLDRNWKVCTQIPRAGRKVPLSTIVRLAAVKLDERCP